MIKKYPWNEPNPKKRSWTDADYSKEQMYYVTKGRGSDIMCSNIDDLNPELYGLSQMLYVFLGRGTDPKYGNVDHIDPRLYDDVIFHIVSVTGKVGLQKYKERVSEDRYKKTLKTIKENNPEWLI